MQLYYLKNIETGKEYTLDTYARIFTDIVYTDIECIAKDIDDNNNYYIRS